MSESEPNESSVPELTGSIPEAEAPRPTYAPATMALGVMMLLWGLTTMWIMSVTGLVVIIWAMSMWISEMQLESDEGNACE